MRSESVSGVNSCELARRWAIEPTLADMLLALNAWADQNLSTEWARWPNIFIISGHRTAPVRSSLNPAEAAATQSRHLYCPALAVDLRVGNAPASTTPFVLWAALGSKWEQLGGRWGGRFDPPDPNHFDIDPLMAGRPLELPALNT